MILYYTVRTVYVHCAAQSPYLFLVVVLRSHVGNSSIERTCGLVWSYIRAQ